MPVQVPNRIDTVFAGLRASGRSALIPYVTTGDPSLAHTLPIMRALAKAGGDIIELGVPFSDPMADGPVVQRASERALAQGVSLRDVLDVVAAFRKDDASTPVVLMGYANPIEAMGAERFVEHARKVGVDGVIVVDYPPEEATAFTALLVAQGIAPIFLLSPTTPEHRIKSIAELASGYVYYVSLKGVTGAGHLDTADVVARLAQIRRHVSAADRRWLRHSRRGRRAGDRRARRRRRDRQPHHPGDRIRTGQRGCAAGRRVARDHSQRDRFGDAPRGVDAHPRTSTLSPTTMSWLQKLLPPRIKATPGVARKAMPEGLWVKCPACEAVLYRTDLEKNLDVCPKCSFTPADRARAYRPAARSGGPLRDRLRGAADRQPEVQGHAQVSRAPVGRA